MIIRESMRIPSIPIDGGPARSEELQSATPAGGVGTDEAKGARSSTAGDRESEKGLDSVLPATAGDLDGVGWREWSVWGVFFDHDTDCWADGGRAGSQVWQCQTGGQGGEDGDGSDESKLHDW